MDSLEPQDQLVLAGRLVPMDNRALRVKMVIQDPMVQMDQKETQALQDQR